MQLSHTDLTIPPEQILRMTKSSQVDGLQGRVINLLSNDFAKFDLAMCFIHDLWKGPLETILLGYLAYREIGYSGIIGIIFILSFIPIQCESQFFLITS